MDATKPKSSVVERILKGAPRLEPEADHDEVRNAFDEVRTAKSRGREALMLDIRKADGQCHGMSYAYLTRIDFEPGDRLKLHFADAVVQIGGRRLHSLYRRLLEHRIDAIQEGIEAEEGLKPEDAAHIDRLQLIANTEAQHDGTK